MFKIMDNDVFKKYKGWRVRHGGITLVTVNGSLLPFRHDVRNHSPDGFEWGYGGSGPAQLALAILLDYSQGNVNFTLKYYQEFKHRVVRNFLTDEWEITSDQVRCVIEEIDEIEADLENR
jgi:hypothetical protein